ncbi:MAG: pantetheine-phosphate adenylyltransferase [Clostridia bacterium]|nr:pantetheine-phosphate adenylyltransferase [Clostridia bacterium]
MRNAIITGSFDPITSGHADLISRAARMFDHVTVVILANTEKAGGAFVPADRLTLVNAAVEELGLSNVSAMLYGGLTSDAAKMLGAEFIVRGARNASDFDYELNLSLIMKRFDPVLETVILPTDPCLSAISSTYVRDLLKYGCDLGDAVPESCREAMTEMYRRNHP